MSITLQKLQTQRADRKKRLHLAIKSITQKLKSMGAIKIILFGSYVSGKIRRWSDLDLIAVMPSTKGSKEWFKEIYDKIDLDVPIDIFPFTPADFEIKVKTSSFIRYALKTGKVIYEKR